jgi:VWFA-related protein
MTKPLNRALNVSVLLAAAILLQPRAGGQTVTDRVEIDVVAADDRGQPVRGLAAGDFTLKEDGRVVDVDSFREVSALGAGGRADGRTLLLVLDDSGVEPQLTTRVQAIARLVVAHMGNADTVSVVHLNRFAEANAGGAALALARIAEFRGGARPFAGRETLETSLEKVEKLSQQFEPLEHRRKAIVGIGSPAVLDIMDPARPTSLIWDHWVRALAAASRANTSLYVIDPSGITGDVKLSGSTGLVAQTGGEAFYNSNKFEAHVERIWSEAGHYYLLGYSPVVSKRELRRIEVTAGRPGVRARARLSRG